MVSLALFCSSAARAADAPDYPITQQQKNTAQVVAQNGVAMSELSPNAPDAYTVKPRNTLWDISRMFLNRPWRWPELWGMNLEQIRNPHLIYPGQVLFLEKIGGRARLRLGKVVGGRVGDEKLSPRVRSSEVGADALVSIPFGLIEPFLNDAVIFDTDALARAPRIVATQANRVILSDGDTAYVRGELTGATNYSIFREPKPLVDPTTKQILGYEALYVGSADYTHQGETRIGPDGDAQLVPATFRIVSVRREAGIGDRLAPAQAREFSNYMPHAPQGPVEGRIVSIYGDGLTAGQNQIVSLNQGTVNGIERGNVLALIRNGERVVDTTDPTRPTLKLPDERHGLLFVFRVFDRMSYALILSVKEPVSPGDRFTQP